LINRDLNFNFKFMKTFYFNIFKKLPKYFKLMLQKIRNDNRNFCLIFQLKNSFTLLKILNVRIIFSNESMCLRMKYFLQNYIMY